MSHTASPVPETCKKSTGSMPTYTCQSEAVKLRAETIQFSDIGIMYSPLSVVSRIMFDQHAHHVFMSCFFSMNWIESQLLTECEWAMWLWLNVTVNNWLTLPPTPIFSTPRRRFRASYRPGFTSSSSQLWALGLSFTSSSHHSSAQTPRTQAQQPAASSHRRTAASGWVRIWSASSPWSHPWGHGSPLSPSWADSSSRRHPSSVEASSQPSLGQLLCSLICFPSSVSKSSLRPFCNCHNPNFISSNPLASSLKTLWSEGGKLAARASTTAA